ncbi:MAG: 4-hydroxy-tetrahydrodipicolinate synthase [Gemmataceae bacterium]|nr:4-hydroxy-tetrahydrodipicolinate synthase [Gemmataceae bacterium]MCI0740316.1 4-hydroxy-tetrahydrodipicolinate synthase [Gemmataceae bacterium]
MQIRGIIPPVATPMQANEDLDLPRFRWFLDHLINAGVHGVFVLGTNSEFYAMDEAEKQAVIATAVEHVRGRVPVYAGTGAETTREAIRLTRMAEKEKVQGVSVITPYFIAPTQQEIFDHYRRIAESTSLPVVLYNNPSTCGGLKIDVDTVARLAEISNILGVKDSSGDLQNTLEFIRVVPDRFSVLQGRDTLIFPALQFGARGAVPATANVAPRILVEIYEAFVRGDLAASKAAQLRLNPVRLSLTLGTAPGGVKAALALMGMSIGPSRSPVAPLPPEKQQKMRAALQSAGLIPN